MKGDKREPIHLPVLLDETLELWHSEGGKFFVDCTVGSGGHSKALLSKYPNIQLLGIDRDEEILSSARENLKHFGERVFLSNGSYAELEGHLERAGFPTQVDGILLDLGVNSYHLDTPERGFSWRYSGPLDMRFSKREPMTPKAKEILNRASHRKLTEIFRRWGELPRAPKLASLICDYRQKKTFQTTEQLVECIGQLRLPPKRERQILTLCFQALRIEVNRELEHLEEFLSHFPRFLKRGGRIAIISFHSLEDRMVKNYFKKFAGKEREPSPLLAYSPPPEPEIKILTKKPIQPTPEEIKFNPRSRSAKLRAAEKL